MAYSNRLRLSTILTKVICVTNEKPYVALYSVEG